MAAETIIQDSILVSFEIKSNGVPINQNNEVVSIHIKLQENALDEAIIIMQHNDSEFNLAASIEFSLERELEISLGYGSINETLFIGSIKQKRFTFKHSDIFTQLTCKRINDETEKITKDIMRKEPLVLTYGINIFEMELDTNSMDPKLLNGYVKIQGTAEARVSDTIEIKDIGHPFPDNLKNSAYVTTVLHDLEGGNWTTTVNIGKTK
jgi:hypothetical protein